VLKTLTLQKLLILNNAEAGSGSMVWVLLVLLSGLSQLAE
jgi:hypothetical protein